MEGCSPFQWGRVCFSDRGGFIFEWGVHLMGEVLVLVGGLKQIVRWEWCPPLWETLLWGTFAGRGLIPHYMPCTMGILNSTSSHFLEVELIYWVELVH